MADIEIFDIDQDLTADSVTQDFKELYQEQAVNQSIDAFIANPYRIGKGLTNSLFASVFADLNVKTEEDLRRDIIEEFENNYPFIEILALIVVTEPSKNRIRIRLQWNLKDTEIAGLYEKFWYNE